MKPSDKDLIKLGLTTAIGDALDLVNIQYTMFNDYNCLYHATELKQALELYIELKTRQDTDYPEADEIPF